MVDVMGKKNVEWPLAQSEKKAWSANEHKQCVGWEYRGVQALTQSPTPNNGDVGLRKSLHTQTMKQQRSKDDKLEVKKMGDEFTFMQAELLETWPKNSPAGGAGTYPAQTHGAKMSCWSPFETESAWNDCHDVTFHLAPPKEWKRYYAVIVTTGSLEMFGEATNEYDTSCFTVVSSENTSVTVRVPFTAGYQVSSQSVAEVR
ncbi:hypothetical protein M427DRAFT_49090 [Gonapodya prolifera JEL478]|uniref:Uncharacterized protein n=1 Tax=Gonapodya prolifera (strain JEL478) TaxID=1344416 RepID=A0A138ZZ86_GONPJ|nr:hypothetical protein M427DRAFT_49090 [Gonapodya prolifera JEL478]|eukprot:KXS09801.1 hypothetical protein M427DRAFT_49090 [Gonapodya prolifera JEL478]